MTKFGLFIPIGKVSHPVLWVAYLALSERGLYPRITSQIWQSDETLGNVPLCFPKDCWRLLQTLPCPGPAPGTGKSLCLLGICRNRRDLAGCEEPEQRELRDWRGAGV